LVQGAVDAEDVADLDEVEVVGELESEGVEVDRITGRIVEPDVDRDQIARRRDLFEEYRRVGRPGKRVQVERRLDRLDAVFALVVSSARGQEERGENRGGAQARRARSGGGRPRGRPPGCPGSEHSAVGPPSP